MKCTVIGAARKSGTYEGRDYDNLVLFVTFEADNMISGLACKTLKIKCSKLAEAFEGCKLPQPIKQPEDAKQLVGKRIKVYCDSYGNPEEVFTI